MRPSHSSVVGGGGIAGRGVRVPPRLNAQTTWFIVSATYCTPSLSYVTAGPPPGPAPPPNPTSPVWNCQTMSPVFAEYAWKLPSGSTWNTRPPAVAVAPPPPSHPAYATRLFQ